MKNESRLVLLCMAAAAAVPAIAQNLSPQCGSSNYDKARNIYSVVRPLADTVNQQCYVTVYPTGAMPAQARRNPTSYLSEGTYIVELSGGGGGGGGGAGRDKGGGGGGAGAAPSWSLHYLSPGTYKLTIGTGGVGGLARGGQTEAGNPTSLTNATDGQLIAGFAGADVWSQRTRPSGGGSGGAATAGGSSGGAGGDSGPRTEERAQAGGASQTPGFAGTPGQAGVESGRARVTGTERGVVQANAGGGGGASVGSGGAGGSVKSGPVPRSGDLGGGGGGGRGGVLIARTGGRGGHGFIRLTRYTPFAGSL